MKISLSLLSLFLCLSVFSQSQALESKVYNWENSPTLSTKTGSIKSVFRGSGAILADHEMKAVTLHKGKKLRLQSADGKELFFIIKSGPVTVTLKDSTAVLDRGSVVYLLPGDQLTIANKGDQPVQFYQMSYSSIAAPDMERGKKAGGSFLLNWKDIAFKATAKGGVRQFFDRQTVMLNRFDIHVTQLNEGFNSHDPNTHKNEEIILMLDGHAEMQIGTTHQKANAGDVVLLSSMILHNLTNIGNTPCLYFAIQWN